MLRYAQFILSAVFCSISVLLLIASPGFTQSEAEHLSHHPELAAQAGTQPQLGQQQAPAAANSGQVAAPQIVPGGAVPPGGAGGMMKGMGEMMKQMGLPPKKDFYPSLVEIPNLSPERWDEIQHVAHVRMIDGLGQVSTGLGSLAAAVDADNFALMQQSLAEMQQGMRMVESGLSAHRLLAEGESPRNIALSWFKTEMNLQGLTALPPQGLFGLSFFHVLVMVLLSLFSATMILMYFFKMRRASALLERLTEQGVGLPPTTTPPENGGGGQTPPSGGTPPSSNPSPTNSVTSTEVGVKAELKKENWAGRLKVSKIIIESPNVKTFRLVNPSGDKFPFTYLPGQFLTLFALIDQKTVARAYSMASSPTEISFCDLTIKREDLGTFSRYLHDLIKEGDLIDAQGPSGLFVFTGEEAKSIVLIGAGIGVTPMMSVLRFLIVKAWPGKITLLFTYRNAGDYLFQSELEELKSKNPNFKLIVTATGKVGSDWSGMRGRFTKEILATVPDLITSRVHICGPTPFMDDIKKLLSELSVPKEAIKIEAFGSMRKDEPVTPLGHEGKTNIVNTKTIVDFVSSGKKAALPPNMSVLEAAESVGVPIENSCRVGTCGICRIRLVSGHVTMEIEDGITAEEKDSGFILACQAKSTENIGVEA
ncbi:MAG TPA: FAD-binding oxidoreductase [Oligoflexia bacterium]|nr:FAD-binding oxidoreductase [Oligoflexia bacterium]HMP49517.1 FAD-binding oxidoreductase [Oligoflexia bacterium]